MSSESLQSTLPPTEELVQVEVRGLIVDPRSRAPIVLLHDVEGHRLLPIWIGPFEAIAITTQLEGVELPRPMTHDLLRTVFEQLGGTVDQVIISDLRENVFYATLRGHRLDRSPLEIDCRSSDAIALALRFEVPLLVHRNVLDEAKAIDLVEHLTEEEQLARWLEAVEPSDLGEYTM